MKTLLFLPFVFLLIFLFLFSCNREKSHPPYLYKIVTVKDWEQSQRQGSVVLGKMDTDFIHLAKEDQIDKVANKFFSQEPSYYILKLNPADLKGRLVLETNPGGTNEYYHLYEGSIPLSAVVEVYQKTPHPHD